VAGLSGVFYVWVNCYGIIAPVQAWTFANMVFDTRQARRLFGLIGSGASLGAIAGGLLARELAKRVGTIDLAVLAWTPPFHPFDTETPAFEIRTLTERSLRIAVPAAHPFAGRDTVDVADLHGERWIAGPPSGEERLMGVWPGLDERPTIAHTARDWLAKLRLVEAGCGITTVGDALADVRPAGVVFVNVRQAERESRRIVLAELPGRETPARRHLGDALAAAGAQG